MDLTSPHIQRLLLKKESDIIEFSNGKKIPKPYLFSSIPSIVTSRAPMVLRGEGLKPFPGMSKFLVVQFVPDSSVQHRDPTMVTQIDVSPCCDKCVLVIVPDLVAGTYNLRMGFHYKKMEVALTNDKVIHNLSIDPFEEIDKRQNHQQQQQQHQNILNHDEINIDFSNVEGNHSDDHQIEHHHHQSQQQQEEEDEMLIESSQPNVDTSTTTSTTTTTTTTTTNNQPQQFDQDTQDSHHHDHHEEYQHQEIYEDIVWSNFIIVVVEGGRESVSRLAGKRSTTQYYTGSPNTLSSNSSTPTHKRSSKKVKATRGDDTSSSLSPNNNNPTSIEDVFNNIVNGNLESVRQYIENKTNEGKVFDFNKRDDDGFTPMHYACAYHWNGLVEYFISCGADPNSPDSDGWTPLHWAIKANNMQAVRMLLDNAADQSVPNYSRIYPVEMAHEKGYSHICETLIGSDYKRDHFDPLPLPPLQQQQQQQSNQNQNQNQNQQSNQNQLSIIQNEPHSPNTDALLLAMPNASMDCKMLIREGLQPYSSDYIYKSGIVEKHNTVKFIQAAEKLGLMPEHRSSLMEAFKSLRTLRYRLFWIMLSNPLFKQYCTWDSDGVHFIIYNSRNLLDVLGLYFGLRGSNSAVDWMSHLARRKSPLKKEMGSSGTVGGDLWTNLRPDTFNLHTSMDKLKDITSDKKEKGRRGKKEEEDPSNTGSLDVSSDQHSLEMTPNKQMNTSMVEEEMNLMNEDHHHHHHHHHHHQQIPQQHIVEHVIDTTQTHHHQPQQQQQPTTTTTNINSSSSTSTTSTTVLVDPNQLVNIIEQHQQVQPPPPLPLDNNNLNSTTTTTIFTTNIDVQPTL